jgi:hypothetical protein
MKRLGFKNPFDLFENTEKNIFNKKFLFIS